jgi:VanZ family protein
MIARVLLVAYLLCIAVVAFWPTPVDRDAHDLIEAVSADLRGQGFPWVTYELIEFSANILFFVPFGALVTWVSGRWWLGILLGVLVAATIEGMQAIALPDRFSTVQDVLANSLGAALGAGVAILLGLVTGLRRRRPRSSP